MTAVGFRARVGALWGRLDHLALDPADAGAHQVVTRKVYLTDAPTPTPPLGSMRQVVGRGNGLRPIDEEVRHGQKDYVTAGVGVDGGARARRGGRGLGHGRRRLAEPPAAECTITGTNGSDNLLGTNRVDVICGFGGDDALVGFEGRDRLRGGPGQDALDTVDDVQGNDAADGGRGGDACSTDRRDARISC